MAGCLFVTARSYPDHIRGLQRWAGACGCQGVAWMLSFARGTIPDFLSIVAANTLLLWAVSLHYQAVKEFKKQTFNKAESRGIITVVFVLFVIFTYAVPNMTARIIIISLSCAYLLLRAAATLFDDRSQKLPFSHQITGFSFTLCATLAIARAVIVLFQQTPDANLFYPNLTHYIASAFLFVAIVILSFGFLLMCSDQFHSDLHHMATVDSLTGSLNRGAIEIFLHKELRASKRTQMPMSLLLIDMDHFKQINDRYGHQVGDKVLQGFVQTASNHLRPQDLLGRYGGEEFMVALPNTTPEEAEKIAERLRTQAEQSTLIQDKEPVHYTISIGLSTVHADEANYETLLEWADTALYNAKKQGRNRIVVANPKEKLVYSPKVK
jgi:diguanylate cyclase (GGDEF)-like protein